MRQWADFFPQKILQTADSLTVLSEYMAQFRQIFLDGRARRYLRIMLDTELIEDICNENEKSFQHIFGK